MSNEAGSEAGRAAISRISRSRVLRGRKPRLLLSGAAVSLAGYAALAIFAWEQQYFALDYGARIYVAMLRHELLNLPMHLVSALGDNVGLIPLILVGSLLLWRVSRRWAIALPLLMAGTGALQLGAKLWSHRPRPDLSPLGFPSGHVLSLVVFFGLMIYLIAGATRRRRRWRILACAVCAVPVVVVAFSRLYLDRHWLSDLAGGLAVGMSYLLLAIWVVEVVLVRPDAIAGAGRVASARVADRPPASSATEGDAAGRAAPAVGAGTPPAA
jgi:undecaprenyl-diphosphatase